MSTRHVCDYPNCEREATTRIVEERYDDRPMEMHGYGTDGRLFGGGLDACDEHRTVTHPGWWCLNHEADLAAQAARERA